MIQSTMYNMVLKKLCILYKYIALSCFILWYILHVLLSYRTGGTTEKMHVENYVLYVLYRRIKKILRKNLLFLSIVPENKTDVISFSLQ